MFVNTSLCIYDFSVQANGNYPRAETMANTFKQAAVLIDGIVTIHHCGSPDRVFPSGQCPPFDIVLVHHTNATNRTNAEVLRKIGCGSNPHPLVIRYGGGDVPNIDSLWIHKILPPDGSCSISVEDAKGLLQWARSGACLGALPSILKRQLGCATLTALSILSQGYLIACSSQLDPITRTKLQDLGLDLSGSAKCKNRESEVQSPLYWGVFLENESAALAATAMSEWKNLQGKGDFDGIKPLIHAVSSSGFSTVPLVVNAFIEIAQKMRTERDA
jgi:hypothetical protein